MFSVTALGVDTCNREEVDCSVASQILGAGSVSA